MVTWRTAMILRGSISSALTHGVSFFTEKFSVNTYFPEQRLVMEPMLLIGRTNVFIVANLSHSKFHTKKKTSSSDFCYGKQVNQARSHLASAKRIFFCYWWPNWHLGQTGLTGLLRNRLLQTAMICDFTSFGLLNFLSCSFFPQNSLFSLVPIILNSKIELKSQLRFLEHLLFDQNLFLYDCLLYSPDPSNCASCRRG